MTQPVADPLEGGVEGAVLGDTLVAPTAPPLSWIQELSPSLRLSTLLASYGCFDAPLTLSYNTHGPVAQR